MFVIRTMLQFYAKIISRYICTQQTIFPWSCKGVSGGLIVSIQNKLSQIAVLGDDMVVTRSANTLNHSPLHFLEPSFRCRFHLNQVYKTFISHQDKNFKTFIKNQRFGASLFIKI